VELINHQFSVSIFDFIMIMMWDMAKHLYVSVALIWTACVHHVTTCYVTHVSFSVIDYKSVCV
jgi:hypothetical protein